ncbi:protein tyrosine phosphatase domain-containing protein 1-like [Dysidea avara]|uniref:protein tyrosine phosphatase domain-containing protein 1-like n=1 Tax=Dysidea avara TaxID=196820 RepID=UPI003329248C
MMFLWKPPHYCHHVVGRTGVLIACHLIFSDHITSDQAVAHVRSKGPGSIQSPVQLQIVQEFYEYLRPKWIVFPSVDCSDFPCVMLDQFMNNQRCILHGAATSIYQRCCVIFVDRY